MDQKPKPHIVHLLGTLRAGGAQRVVLNIVSDPQMKRFRHSVVCLLAKQGDFLGSFERQGISVYFSPVRWPANDILPSYRLNRWLRDHLLFTFPYRFANLLKNINADLVHSHLTAYIGLQGKAVIRKLGLPWVWTIHGLYRSRGEVEPGWKEAFQFIENFSKARVTGVSEAAIRDVVGSRLPPNKIRLIPNGVSLHQYNRKGEHNFTWRARYGIPSRAIVFGTAGRLIPLKRHNLFIEAASRVIRESCHLDIHCVIAGTGPMRDSLQQKVREYGLEDRIHLVGYQSDMPSFLKALDVFVLPSDTEAFPMVLAEACAASLPIIATSVGGVPDILGENRGLLVPPGSVNALADAMQRMLDPKVREYYSKRARSVATRYSLEKINGAYAQLYDELLSR